MFNNILLAIGLGLLLAALALAILLLNERRVRRAQLIAERHRALGLPEGELVYEDADGLGEPLSSSAYPLVGKPDYVVKLADGRPVPIELKLNVHDVTAPHQQSYDPVGSLLPHPGRLFCAGSNTWHLALCRSRIHRRIHTRT